MRKLIREMIKRILNESGDSSEKRATDLLLSHVRKTIDKNLDSSFMDDFDISSMAKDNNVTDKIDLYLEELFENMNNQINELSESVLWNNFGDLFNEIVDKIETGEDVNIQEYYLALDDLYFEDGTDDFIQKNVEKIFEECKSIFNDKIKKLSDDIAKQEEIKRSLQYSANFPIACSGWFVVVDSYGVAIPESCFFHIVEKNGDKIQKICGADFPIEINGVEIYDIDPQKRPPLIASYQGGDKVVVPSV